MARRPCLGRLVLYYRLIFASKAVRMPKLHQIIERHWQSPNPFLSLLLKPLSKLFAKVAAKRRDDFVSGRLKSEKLPVPVVVVGNIHAGGTGKTPIVAALVSGLQEKGIKVGIISRGYGRKSKAVHVLNTASSAADAGDEPLLLFRQTGAPTAVGSSRSEACNIMPCSAIWKLPYSRRQIQGAPIWIYCPTAACANLCLGWLPLMRLSSAAGKQIRHSGRLKICLPAILKQGRFTV